MKKAWFMPFAVITIFAAAVLLLLSSCYPGAAVEGEYILTFSVTGEASTVDVVYTDLTGDTVVFSSVGETVPYTREVTGTIDYSQQQSYNFTATGDVPAGGSLSVGITYQEVLVTDFEGNEEIIKEDTFTNNGPATAVNSSVSIDFSLPPR